MKEEFETRKQEVELYFDFLQKIAGDEHHVTRVADGIAAYSAADRSEIVKTFKANGFLLLYNLMESTVKNSVEAIYDELQEKDIHFDACRDEVRRIVLFNLRRWDVDKILPSIGTIARDVVASTFRKEEVFSGNVDARAIRETAKGYGFRAPTRKSDQLLTVKTNRNDLAHGNKSFADVGRDYDMQRLMEIKTEVIEYLEELIANIESYIASSEYLSAALP